VVPEADCGVGDDFVVALARSLAKGVIFGQIPMGMGGYAGRWGDMLGDEGSDGLGRCSHRPCD
jgi:hypothetical protein